MGGKNVLTNIKASNNPKLQPMTGVPVTLPGSSTGRPQPKQTIDFSFTSFPQ
jgi:hypothetical protein